MKKLFKHRIKEGSYQIMSSVLKYPETGLAIVDDGLCSIIDIIVANEHYLKQDALHKSTPVMLYQIEVLNSPIKAEAIILAGQLEELPILDWVYLDN